MIRRTPKSLLILCWLALNWPLSLVASEIFHWVDEQGVNHFSQSPPPDHVVDVEVRTLEIDGSQPASYDPKEDRYNVAAQAEAMQALRDELEQVRQEKRAAQQNAASNTVVFYPEQNAGSQILYPPGFWNRPGNRPPFPRPPRPPGSKPDRPGTLPEDVRPPSQPFRPPRR
jgi:hypothetical protein